MAPRSGSADARSGMEATARTSRWRRPSRAHAMTGACSSSSARRFDGEIMQRLRNLLLVTTALLPFLAAPAAGGPSGATVVGGSANVQNPGTANVTVNQFSDKAIINW